MLRSVLLGLLGELPEPFWSHFALFLAHFRFIFDAFSGARFHIISSSFHTRSPNFLSQFSKDPPEALPTPIALRGRAAAERVHTRSYGLAVSIVGGLLPLSPCSSSWLSRSCSRCSCCSCCSRHACNACTLSRLSRFPFHDSQVFFWSQKAWYL